MEYDVSKIALLHMCFVQPKSTDKSYYIKIKEINYTYGTYINYKITQPVLNARELRAHF
jgi:hypothetical protein